MDAAVKMYEILTNVESQTTKSATGGKSKTEILRKLETKASPRRQCSTGRILSHELPLRG